MPWNPFQNQRKSFTDRRLTILCGRYSHGVKDTTLLAPDAYELDSALLARSGNDEIQLDLFLDYAGNVALYPKFQEYFRTKRPPVLALAIVIGGYQFAHGEPGGKKALAGVAAGTGIAVHAANVLTWLWGV